MSTRSQAIAVVLSLLSGTLAGCDPGVHFALQKDFTGTVDYDCIENALRSVAPDVRRGSYKSDGYGPRGFERGITVTQFNYSDPTFLGGYTLDVALQPDGNTHYWHEWGKIGTDVTADEQSRIRPLLMRANRAIEQNCRMSFKGTVPSVGDG